MKRLFLIAAFAACTPVCAQGVLSIGGGADYSSGEYGKVETTSVSMVYLNAKYETGRWTYRATLPYLRISGPANVVGVGTDVIVLPDAPAGRRDVSGAGDITAAASYKAIARDSVIVELGAGIKLPTADESKGLGTGETDYAVQADFYLPIGAGGPFATLGYRWYGDPPGIELRNAYFGSVGYAWRDASGTSLGFAYDFRDRTVEGGARASELMVFVSHTVASWKGQIYFLKGFSDASPDAGVGVTLSYAY